MKFYQIRFFVFTAIVLMAMAGCKKNNKDTQHLQEVVAQLNTGSGTELSQGTMLTKCEYKDGDSIFTYYVKVTDKRFENVSQTDIKDSVSQDLANPRQKKLLKLLADNDLNLQYIFDTDTKTIPIIFTTTEIKTIIKQ